MNIGYDRFPSRVMRPTGQFQDRARSAIVDDELFVWTAGGVLMLRIPVSSWTPATRQDRYVEAITDQGTYQIYPTSGCGCGSVVKGMALAGLVATAGASV